MSESKLLVVLFLLCCSFLQSKAADKTPNIIVMLMDDVSICTCNIWSVYKFVIPKNNFRFLSLQLRKDSHV